MGHRLAHPLTRFYTYARLTCTGISWAPPILSNQIAPYFRYHTLTEIDFVRTQGILGKNKDSSPMRFIK